MSYDGRKRHLFKHALKMIDLGWKMGVSCTTKEFVAEISPNDPGFISYKGELVKHVDELWEAFDQKLKSRYGPTWWDTISVCLDPDLVVVDIDDPTILHHLTFSQRLPATMKEKTKRGWHLYYKTYNAFVHEPVMKWNDSIDFLVDNSCDGYITDYGADAEWYKHVLCAPSQGYELLYPEEPMRRDQITEAPGWIIDVLKGKGK